MVTYAIPLLWRNAEKREQENKNLSSLFTRYYVFFHAFPTTGTGKTDRRAIRTAALDNLAMVDSAVDGRFEGNVQHQ